MAKRITSSRSLRILVPALYVAATVALFAALGIPYQRDILTLWVMLGLLCFSLADLRGSVRGIVIELLPFVAILIAYDSLRGTAGRLFAVHYLPQLDVDRWLFGGSTPTVWLQHRLWHGQVLWYDVVLWCVYLSHFFATPVLAAILWKLHRPRFRMFAVLVATLSLMGLATYALFPAAPPWMAAQAHLTAPITRIIPIVMASVGTKSAGSLIEHGYAYANNVAAVPSLHTAFALLIAITLWPVAPRRLRALVALYPLAMGFTLVYTGEHYVVDVLLGWIYTVAAVLAGQALLRAWMARRALRSTRAQAAYAGARIQA
jgi:membrane-associated phospholipid phosphatase